MENSQKGFVIPAFLVVVALLVIGGGVYVYQSKKIEVPAVKTETPQLNQTQQTNTQIPLVTTQSAQTSEEKNKNDIQDLLRRQCQAFTNKDLKSLIDTIDQNDASLFQKYKKSVEILFSMTSSVVSCQYEIQDIKFKFKETTGGLIAETTVKGDLKIKLIDNSTKTIENPNVLIQEKYVFSNNKWKQIISK